MNLLWLIVISWKSKKMSKVWTHKEFKEKLAQMGIKLTIEASSGQTDYHIYLNGISLCTSDYKYFGHLCGGVYNPVDRTNQVEFTAKDLANAYKKSVETLNNYIKSLEADVNFNDCIEFLSEYSVSKTDAMAAQRMKKALNENYQQIRRSKVHPKS